MSRINLQTGLVMSIFLLSGLIGNSSADYMLSDFENFNSTAEMHIATAWAWPSDNVATGDPAGQPFDTYLDTTVSSPNDPNQSMRLEYDPSGYTYTSQAFSSTRQRYGTARDLMVLSPGSTGIRFWIKATGPGVSNPNFTYRFRWWDSNTRWTSPLYSLSGASGGEYRFIPWGDFRKYGAVDNTMDLDFYERSYIQLVYGDGSGGTVPANSDVTVWVDEITTYRVPGYAYSPSPPDVSIAAELTPILSWSPGEYTQNVNGHDVYFGTNWYEVNNADTSDLTGIYRGRQDANSYDPGALKYFTTYYWRIDDVNDINIDSPWKGKVWRFTTPAFILTFLRDPYLQNVTTSSVDVMWGTTNDVNNGTVYWGDTPENYPNSVLSNVFTDVDGDYIHTATITGLSPRQKIYYYVSSGGDVVGQNDPTYYAVAAPADDAPFRFGAYGDSRPAYGNDPDIKPHIRVVNTMRLHKPDIVLHMGDIAREGYLWEFTDYYFAPTSPLAKNTPVFLTVGNHELYEDRTGRNYRDVYSLPTNSADNTEDYYSFDYGPVHFICLNTELLPGGAYNWQIREAKRDAMNAWLEEDLAASTKPWKIVFFHRQYYLPNMDNNWREFFEDYGVDLVLAGHAHHYDSHERGEVTYIVTGGGGSPLSGIPWQRWRRSRIAAFRDFHFVRVDVSLCKLHLKAYDDDNVMREEIIIYAEEDTTPPELSLSVTPEVLWPVNHKMVKITPDWTVSDNCDESPQVSLVSVTMNEADDGKGDGHTTDDIQIGDDGSIYLRAERSGRKNDRVYTITYQAIDDSGNTTTASTTVTVPHDRR